MNKKGEGDVNVVASKWWYYILVLFLFMVCVIAFVGKGFAFVDSRSPVTVFLVEDVQIARLTNVCFNYEENGRVYANVLDKSKLRDTRLKECMTQGLIVTITSPTNEFKPIIMDTSQSTPKKSHMRYIILRDGENSYAAHMKVDI